MNLKWKNAIDWLLPVFLILFILEVIAFPFAVGLTYAGRSEDPNHTLTYRTNELTWSDVQGIDENGVAELSIFDAEYEHVSASDGSAVVAPGTKGQNIIRLKNDADGEIEFTTVCYMIKSDSGLPVEARLADGNFTDTTNYRLPDGVKDSQVLRAVAGSLRQGEKIDFDISWLWDYEIGEEQDLIDVDFGDRSAQGEPDDVKVGFYLVVEDNNQVYVPQTGDDTGTMLYITLMGISGAMLLLLIIFRKRERRRG